MKGRLLSAYRSVLFQFLTNKSRHILHQHFSFIYCFPPHPLLWRHSLIYSSPLLVAKNIKLCSTSSRRGREGAHLFSSTIRSTASSCHIVGLLMSSNRKATPSASLPPSFSLSISCRHSNLNKIIKFNDFRQFHQNLVLLRPPSSSSPW